MQEGPFEDKTMGDCCLRMHALAMGFKDQALTRVVSNAFLHKVKKFAEGEHTSGDLF